MRGAGARRRPGRAVGAVVLGALLLAGCVPGGSGDLRDRESPSAASTTTTTTSPPGPSPSWSEPAAHPRPEGMPAWLDVPPPPPPCPAADVVVRTAEDLHRALADARPGDVVALADGRYRGRFVAERAGTQHAPVHLCGGPGAVLEGEGPDEGYVLHLDGASHWVVQGFTVTRGQKGVMVDAATGVALRGLHVHDVGDEAVHLRRGTTDSLVEHLLVHGTGAREPEFGEGLYVGSAHSNWCDLTGCEPDRSDRNRLVGNVVWGTTAEPVDVKEGTTGGELRGNRLDGAGMRGDGPDSWVALKGNDWLVVGNEGRHGPGDGFQVTVERDGWGRGNVLERNSGRLAADDGVLVAVAPEVRSVTDVACSNVLRSGGRRTTDDGVDEDACP